MKQFTDTGKDTVGTNYNDNFEEGNNLRNFSTTSGVTKKMYFSAALYIP